MKDPLDNAIDLDSMLEQEEAESLQQGLTPMQRQNIDESRIDEILVDEALDDKDYPSIGDIADEDAVNQSFDDE
ncbi:hypothetical protein [Psychrobacter sp. FDAARGOS_221]|uniref:hypothetical protein n=1 Tax=Psychrobacter sp. FDAARGOS_221 TaxID=1975705 RepID=UPI000BB55E83|nr:hypothetical protein [Psychrobacter sp. FDAARGOS_221]PNK61104.1 hypothetical protein A6J60_009610 [Psychrobacter sp. FDAARGOS_221]